MLRQRLDQRQVQKLILAPALQQAIKLLPLTNLELLEVIDAEISENPMIELEEMTGKGTTDEGADERDIDGRKKAEEILENLSRQTQESGSVDDEEADFESSFQDYLDDGFRVPFLEKREPLSLENMVSTSPSLWDHLNWQASLTFFEAEDREIAHYIIGNIDEDGYLSSTVEEIAGHCRTTQAKINEIREKIKMFDPVGSGSLDLSEVLLAQMDHLQIKDESTRTIVSQHLPLLEKSDYSQLAKLMNVPLSEVKYHIDIIKSLDPAPGRKYSQEKTSYAVPDIIVAKEGDELRVSLNDEGLPRLRLSLYYKKLLAKAAHDNPEAFRFLKDKMKKALWFLRSLDQRNQTIYKVATYIVNKQKDFLEKGIDYIKPLTLMEIAQEIGVHESTVGRVVANKYIMTPQGVYSLKYFFHKSLQGDYGEEISSLKIKEKIKKIVETEDKNNPLSDIEIGDILAKENLKIARRTVAKYRNQLKILPSHIRKRKSIMEGIS